MATKPLDYTDELLEECRIGTLWSWCVATGQNVG